MSESSPKYGQYPESWPLTVDQKATLAASEIYHFQKPESFEDAPIRDAAVQSAMRKLFDRLDGTRTPEHAEFLAGLEAQYGDAVSVWTTKYPLNVEQMPSVKNLTQWLSTLSSETLDGLRELGATTLEIVPAAKTTELLRLLDQNKTIPDQINSKNWWPEFWDKVGSDAWKFAITNAQEDLAFDPTIFYAGPEQKVARTNEQMVAEYKRRFAEKGVGIMPPHGYVPTAARQMAQGKVIDKRFGTAFERPVGAGVLPGAFWYGGRVGVGGTGPGYSGGGLRCRPWVEGR